MDDTMILYRENGRVFQAGFSDGVLTGLHVTKEASEQIPGSLYIGRVEKLVPGMFAAFVSIGKEENLYLPFDKAKALLAAPRHADGKLHAGDQVLVQIEKEASKNKPATAVGNFSLTGAYVVLMHGSQGVYFSSKITDDALIQKWKGKIKERRPNGYAVMLRTNAAAAEEAVILRELNELEKIYARIVTEWSTRSVGNCIHQALSPYLAHLRDAYSWTYREYVTDDTVLYEQMKQYFTAYRPELLERLRLSEQAGRSLSAVYNMKANLSQILARKVWLKSGAFLVIDPTEAMTVIDVNTGKATAAKKLENGFLQVNQEAALEICRQMRLRNLSGIIIVDFIDMKKNSDKQELMDLLTALVKEDPVKTKVIEMTRLNLVEITRMKKEKPIYEALRDSEA